MKIDKVEEEIIKQFVVKNKQERILWELRNLKKREQVFWRFAGPNILSRECLKKMEYRSIEELELSNSVELKGLTKNSMQDMVKCGMFLITSDYEGISNSLLEAMAVGLPCVSTDHTPGGARLLIKHGKNGLLAPVGNFEKLAECMCAFVEDEILARNCGEKAKEVLSRFAPEKIIDQWEEYILRLCKKGKKQC